MSDVGQDKSGKGGPVTIQGIPPWRDVLEDFFVAVLQGIDVPVTDNSLMLMLAWATGENTKARNNPLATIMSRGSNGESVELWADDPVFNDHTVKNFATITDGIEATIATLSPVNKFYYSEKKETGISYADVVEVLKDPNASIADLKNTVSGSLWGTRHFNEATYNNYYVNQTKELQTIWSVGENGYQDVLDHIDGSFVFNPASSATTTTATTTTTTPPTTTIPSDPATGETDLRVDKSTQQIWEDYLASIGWEPPSEPVFSANPPPTTTTPPPTEINASEDGRQFDEFEIRFIMRKQYEWGTGTENRTRILQGILGLEIDGDYDAETRAAHVAAQALPQMEDTGGVVNPPSPPLPVNVGDADQTRVGILKDAYQWGRGTEEKTRILQETLGMPVDGFYGPQTLEAHKDAVFSIDDIGIPIFPSATTTTTPPATTTTVPPATTTTVPPASGLPIQVGDADEIRIGILQDDYQWGRGTEEKTRILQGELGISADGFYGAQTLEAHKDALFAFDDIGIPIFPSPPGTTVPATSTVPPDSGLPINIADADQTRVGILRDAYEWGRGTYDKTIILQEELGIPADGFYGPQTLEAHIDAVFAIDDIGFPTADVGFPSPPSETGEPVVGGDPSSVIGEDAGSAGVPISLEDFESDAESSLIPNRIGRIIGDSTGAVETIIVDGVPTETFLEEDWADIAAQNGYGARWLLHAEIGPILRQATQEGWFDSDTGILRFQAEMRKTNWYQTHTEASRQFQITEANDPATAAELISDQVLRIQIAANRVGLNLPDERMRQMGRDAHIENWSQYEVNQYVILEADWVTGGAGGAVEDNYRVVDKLAGDYMVGHLIDDETRDEWATGLWLGDVTEAGIVNDVASLSESAFPSLTARIQQGYTARQILNPLSMEVSRLLPDVGVVDFMTDSRFQPIIHHVQEDGSERIMTVAEVGKHVRNLEDWQTTDAAKASAQEFADFIGKKFGKVA